MVTAIIVGAGHRAVGYANYALDFPEKLKIVGVADPSPERRAMTAKKFGLAPEQCYSSAEELAALPKQADAIINGTMDRQHVPTTIPLLERGYDVLLEKPFAVSIEEVEALSAAVRKTGRKVMICHVLRYAPFYYELKRRVLAGEIGRLITLETAEHVSYHHYSTAFARGKWHREDECGSSFLMSKCCHDLDLLTWYMSGVSPVRVASFGGLHYFTRENAPANSGEHCLLDCPIEKECPYSVRQLYLNHPERWVFYVWPELEESGDLSIEAKTARLRDPSNPYSRCIWKMDNNVADRQSVVVEFADGTVATHNLVGGASRPMRKIHLLGTTGELEGVFDDNEFTLRHIDTRPGCETHEERFNLADLGDTTGAFGGHGGGDGRLVADFVSLLDGGSPSISCTMLSDSINGHKIGFYADRAMREHRVIEFREP